MWQEILKRAADEDLGSGRQPVLPWLLFQGESASCERQFGLAQTLKDEIGGAHSYEPYLLVRVNGPWPDCAGEVIEEMARKGFADKGLSFANAGAGWCKKIDGSFNANGSSEVMSVPRDPSTRPGSAPEGLQASLCSEGCVWRVRRTPLLHPVRRQSPT